MRKMILNIMATTGITLFLLAVIATCYSARFLCVESVFQSLFANVLMHLGIYGLSKPEFRYPIMESVLSIGYTIMVALICGKIFHWYESMPIGVLALMTMVVYLLGCWLSVIKLRKEVNDINILLQRRKEHRN